MTYASGRMELILGIKPRIWSMITLVIIESVIILSWTLLAAILFNLIFGYYPFFLPFCYLLAALLLAWIEHHGSRNSQGISPLEVICSVEIASDRNLPSLWQSFRRVFLTPVFALPFGFGLINIQGKRSLLNIISGTKIVKLDRSADPSPEHELKMFHYSAILKVTGYTLFSAVISLIILFASLQQDTQDNISVIETPGHLSQYDALLLVEYLELSTAFPDSLEFHVRLSSLYYRNDMISDLTHELEEVHRLNPEHTILMLADDFDIEFNDLETSPDSIVDSVRTSDVTISARPVYPVTPDINEDSLVLSEVLLDSISLEDSVHSIDSVIADFDTLVAIPDSDTLMIAPDSAHFEVDTLNTIREPLIPVDTIVQIDDVITPDLIEVPSQSIESPQDTVIVND